MNKKKMIESETQIKRMTKNELKQWLTKHDQRLPTTDKKKPYYLDKAITYFRLLKENENRNRSRSKIKQKTKIKTQRRHSSINESPKPSLTKSKRKVIKVKRKTATKQSPSLTKSLKKKRDRVRRATADHATLAKDIDNNNKNNNNTSIIVDSDDIDSESENVGDFNNYQQFERSNNLKKRQFICSRDPEKMTIKGLQGWLDGNKIDFQRGQKKATYVKLVRKHSLPSSFNSNANSANSSYTNNKKRSLSPKYKQNNSPNSKKQKIKINNNDIYKDLSVQKKFVSPVRKNNINNAPLPRNIRHSPLTPPRNERDDEKEQKEGKEGREEKKSGVLLTPALNKTGIRPIETPEKAAMRDEIRCLLNLDDDENDLNPVYALKDSITNNNNDDNNNDSGITPGGPSNYDPEVLNNVLSDVRREQEKQKYIEPQQKYVERSPLKSAANEISDIDIEHDLNQSSYNNEDDMDSKENDCINVGNVAPNSFFNSIMNKFSPYKQVSQSAMKQTANSVFKLHDTSIIRKGKRTIPSPASTEDSPEHYHDHGNNYYGNNHHSGSVSMSMSPPTIHHYKQNQHNDNDDDIPQTPAVPNYNQPNYNQYQAPFNIINPRKSPPLKKLKKNTPPKSIPVQKPEINLRHNRHIRNPSIGQNAYIHPKRDDPAIIPPKNNQFKNIESKHNVNNSMKETKTKTNGMRKIFGKFTLFTLIVALISYVFILFDGVIYINNMIDRITEIINNFNIEEETLFCDKNKEIISGLALPSDFKCYPCPQYASICRMGRVKCMTNYILQDNKCIVDGVIVKLAFDIRDQLVKILSLRRGESECGESLDEDYSMTQQELMLNTEIIDERKKSEAFEYFKKNILPESQLISMNKYDRYYCHISIKSPKCRIKEWAIDNILGLIATFIIIVLIFAIWRKQKAAKREKEDIELMTNEIYKLLQEFDQFEPGQHIPVQRIKQRIQPKSNKIWNEAEKIIQTDVQIQKSMRMISGLQRKCWKISISKLPSISNDNQGFRFPPYSKHSMW